MSRSGTGADPTNFAHSRRLGLALAIALISLAALAPAAANAYVYWASTVDTGTIGRANLDGTGAIPNLATAGPGDYPSGVTVDAGHIYWGNNTTLGRSNLDGSETDNSFIPSDGPFFVAVDAGHVYWVNNVSNTIGRADLDGTNINQSFITAATGLFGLTVDAGHVYWTNAETGKIGRADIDGGNVNQSFIDTGDVAPNGVAVNADHIYWTSGSTTSIGRADIGGANVNATFIDLSDGSFVNGIAVDGSHIYWSDAIQGTIGRSNLDGTSPNESFITGLVNPTGVAVDAGFPHAHTVHRKLSLLFKRVPNPSPFILGGPAFQGTVAAATGSESDPRCIDGRTVSIFKQRRGPDRKLGTATSQNGGTYVLLHKRRAGTYYAKIAKSVLPSTNFGKATCTAARSHSVTLK